MKKLVTLACLVSLTFAAFAAGNLKADDCDIGKFNSKKEAKPGFTFVPAKGISVEDKSKEPIKNGDVAYTKRIKLGGVEDSIQFSAKKGEVVKIVATSSNKDDAREVSLRNVAGKKIGTLKAPAWNMASPKFTEGTIEIPADGDYVVRGVSGGGLYIFEIDVK